MWPRSAINSWERAKAWSKLSPASTTSAPWARTASTLIWGVVTGMTMTALQPSFFAARATPWAWFPAEAAMTPWARCSGASRATLL